ncbi:hypothetical protein F5Y07DRAFT_396534 [Xylaria sp. FL0933]|nr:hypothetical protein F5Y07DRAFT_396534 [Xylaria sp. FL0933]
MPLDTQRVFRAIFMSPCDIVSASCSTCLERLYNLNAGQDSGIIFLLRHDDEQRTAELPIIPVDSVAAVPARLAAIQSQLPSSAANRKLPSPASHLLPFCSDGVPLAEHTVNILTDTTSGFGDLVDKLSTNDVFESEIGQLLGDDAEKLGNFWADDHLVD